MKLQSDNEDEYRSVSVKMPTVILVASVAIFVVLAIVLAANSKGKKTNNSYNTVPKTEEQSTVESTEPDKLTAADLDFWDMYKVTPNDGEEADNGPQTRKDELELREEQMKAENGGLSDTDGDEDEESINDGKHTQVVHMDGTQEWIPINSSLKLNNYDDTLFQSSNGIIAYMSGNQKITKTGADISQYTTSVDWDRLATEVDYVMIRVGARGYDTGKIIADTKFVEYVKSAISHGIPFGVYFSSQAISLDEAHEEAKYVTDQLQLIRNEISNPNSQTEQSTTATVPQNFTPGTVVVTDDAGNRTTTTVDEKGNSTIVITDINNNVVSTTTINSDNYGNTSTVETDANGNLKKTKLEQKNAATGEITITDTIYNADGTVTTNTETRQMTQEELATVVYTGTGNNTGANQTTDTSNQPKTFEMNYPVAIDMHFIANDTSRLERISKTERTNILTAFCADIENSGYNSMVYANKEFLLCQVNLAGLNKYDIWLLNEGNLPDYPYIMSMWKYATGKNELKSLTGDYGIDVGFIDYYLR